MSSPDVLKGIAVPTTTHSLKSPYRVWGKTIDILACLSEFGGLTPREISDKTFIPRRHVRIYAKRLFLRGFVEPVSMGGYQLTPTGIVIISYYNNNNRQQIGNKQATNRQQIGNKCFKQFTLQPWQSNRTEYEVVVVEYLVAHFKATGSKWVWKQDIDPEKIGVPPSDLNKTILKLLRDRILYKFKDPDFQIIKYGLTKTFLEGYQYI